MRPRKPNILARLLGAAQDPEATAMGKLLKLILITSVAAIVLIEGRAYLEQARPGPSRGAAAPGRVGARLASMVARRVRRDDRPLHRLGARWREVTGRGRRR